MTDRHDPDTELIVRMGALIKAVSRLERAHAENGTAVTKAMTDLVFEKRSAQRALTSILRRVATLDRKDGR